MEDWEYAAGTCDWRSGEADHWTAHSNPGSFENARLALNKIIHESGDETWVIDPCIVRRSERYPTWQKVEDHSAELLAEAMLEIAHTFRRVGPGVVQGNDLYAAFVAVTRKLSPTTNDPREFD